MKYTIHVLDAEHIEKSLDEYTYDEIIQLSIEESSSNDLERLLASFLYKLNNDEINISINFFLLSNSETKQIIKSF